MSIVSGRIARVWGALTGRYRGRVLLALAIACLAAPGLLYLVPGTVSVRASVCATSLFWESPEPARLLAPVTVNAMKVSSGGKTWEILASAGPYQLSELRAAVPYAARVRYWPAMPLVAQSNRRPTRGDLELKLLSRAPEPVSAGAVDRPAFSAVLYNPSSQVPWVYRQNGQEIQSQDTQVRFEGQTSRFDVMLGLSVDEGPSGAFTLERLGESAPSGAVGLRVEPDSVSFSEQESDAEGKPMTPRSTIRAASVDLMRIGAQSLADGQSFTLDPPGITRIERLLLDSGRGCIEAIASGRTHGLCIDNQNCTKISLLERWMGKEQALDLVKTMTLATIVAVLGAVVHSGVLGGRAS